MFDIIQPAAHNTTTLQFYNESTVGGQKNLLHAHPNTPNN